LPISAPSNDSNLLSHNQVATFSREECSGVPLPFTPPKGQSMTRKKILIVEDNEDNRHILIYRLRKIGDFEIKEAANGQDALAMIVQDPPDLLFLDLKLPVLDGWETARRIRAMQSPMKNLPIIALTAQAMVGDEEKALAAGCSDYIAKPIIDSSIVKEKVRRFLPST
jgi:two-component system, cell cycle response regulator DivK